MWTCSKSYLKQMCIKDSQTRFERDPKTELIPNVVDPNSLRKTGGKSVVDNVLVLK